MMRHAIRLGVLACLLGTTALVAPATADDKKEDAKKDTEGWVQLFNGKDLTGWQVYGHGTGPQLVCDWRVEDGVLVGRGPTNYLFTEGGDYDNFAYRVEAMINDGGNSGQYFRTEFGPSHPKGYEAQINATHKDPIRTGSLYPMHNLNLSDEDRAKVSVLKQLHKPDEWFTQEVIADGNHIIIKVNGETTVDWVDKANNYTKGHFALQQHDTATVVKFRKIEYRPLSSEKGNK
jgi:hypothetical protein